MTSGGASVQKGRCGVLMPFSRQAVCPSCERYIGSVARCPYCEGESAGTPSLRALRRAILPLATLALLALLASARLRLPPRVSTCSFAPSMNFATVRVCGRVLGRVKHWRQERGDSLAFQLADSNGVLRVAVDSAASMELIRRDAVPGAGTCLDVCGTLQVRQGQRPLLRVHSARQLRVLGQAHRRMDHRAGGAHD